MFAIRLPHRSANVDRPTAVLSRVPGGWRKLAPLAPERGFLLFIRPLTLTCDGPKLGPALRNGPCREAPRQDHCAGLLILHPIGVPDLQPGGVYPRSPNPSASRELCRAHMVGLLQQDCFRDALFTGSVLFQHLSRERPLCPTVFVYIRMSRSRFWLSPRSDEHLASSL